ncbi:MAG TPA: TetR/AcrR family transcriptional regulator [Pseudonocardiaceae bacterium]|nr:TetR/AcrR family transcriptional regulator [Pseudonocardiaceae bacterium]
MGEDIVARPRKERSDAVRNRAKILEVTSRLFAEHGVDHVSMDQIAAEAGVGKGTLFRRFGDKAGLGVALLDERERTLQDALASGPPPLGPGAPAGDRLRAFLAAYSEFLDANLDLVHMSETASPGARYRVGGYLSWQPHVRSLIVQARPDLDAEYLAHLLLAGLAADLRKATRGACPTRRAADAVVALACLLLTGRVEESTITRPEVGPPGGLG